MRTWAGDVETSVQAITRLPSGLCANLGNPLARAEEEDVSVTAVSYTHLTLPTIYSV